MQNVRAKARSYKWEHIFIEFSQNGNSFSDKQPHSDVFYQVLNYLKKYGFQWGRNPSYEENFKILSKYHRRAINKNLIADFEISARGITIEITHEKNLHGGCSTGHWDSWHNKYSPLSYIEKKEIQLTSLRIGRFLKDQFGIEIYYDFEENKTPQEFIFDKENRNKHIHDGAQTFSEIAEYVENDKLKSLERGWGVNRNYIDANGKEIKCGDVKYFYSWKNGNRFCRGTVWHNINNMWWVIMADGTLNNKASFDLMDFDKKMIGRKPIPKGRQIERLENEIKNWVDKKNFRKCAEIQQKIDLLIAA